MAAQKILVVIGATGNQGGSIIKSVLGDATTKAAWKLRGTTRDPNSDKAKALTAQGVECVSADLNSKAELSKAFAGADAVFAVTNYWEKMDKDLEVQQGKNVADAAKEQGVKQLIWSSLYDINKLTKGKYPNVYHFDSKAHVEEYVKSISQPATFYMPGFYMSNLDTMVRKGDDGAYSINWPMPEDTPIPLLDASDDTGKFVKAIITHSDKTLGKRVYGATGYYTPKDIIAALKKAKPNSMGNAKFNQLPPEVFTGILESTGMPNFVAVELTENFTFMHEFGYYGKGSLDWSLSLLDEKPTSLEEFVVKNSVWKDLN